jgi:hypothetical protein
MEPNEYVKCCQAIEEGDEILLEEVGSHRTGRLLYCSGDQFQVESEGKREVWAPERTEEIGSSSESPHGNI